MVSSGVIVTLNPNSSDWSMPESPIAELVKEQGYYSWTVGADMEVISIYDGIFNKPHDEGFIVGATIN